MADFSFFRRNDSDWAYADEMPQANRSRPQRRVVVLVGGGALMALLVGLGFWYVSKPEPRRMEPVIARLDLVPEIGLVRPAELPANATNPNRPTFDLSQQKDRERQDGFVRHLKESRRDLAGLPFQMSPGCTLPATKAASLQIGSVSVRSALGGTGLNRIRANDPEAETAAMQLRWSKQFWGQWNQGLAPGNNGINFNMPFKKGAPMVNIGDGQPISKEASLPALVQIMEPEAPSFRLGLVENVSALPTLEATEALARRAIFDLDPTVRRAALDALRARPVKEYSATLLRGLSHPLPHVNQEASKALVFLNATELAPQIIDMLDQPEPAAPYTEKKDGKDTTLVREVVRVNHHRNCMLCHPGSTNEGDLVRGLVPSPNTALFSADSDQYGGSDVPPGSVFVRADTTYLRQDFSVMMPVEDAAPWPKMQRFDFLVRTREATQSDVKRWQEQVAQRGGAVSTHQLALLNALRGLTGKDEGIAADAWRKALAAK